ncbi:MAG: filamentous hemagglutinin N-terminal domain-containing protein [Verrucomicrobiota bacterium]
MKRLAALLLLAGIAVGGYLLFQIAKPDPHVIQVNSDHAIINVSGEDWEEWLEGDGLKLLTPDENSTVLIRVDSEDPVEISGKLASSGGVHVIAPNGLLVGENAGFDVAAVTSTLGPPAGAAQTENPEGFEIVKNGAVSPIRAELVRHGNVYALAIKEKGAVRASDGWTIEKDGSD